MTDDPLAALGLPPDAETQEMVARVDRLLADLPPVAGSSIDQLRTESANPASIVRLEGPQDRTIPGPAGDVPVRIYVPDDVNGVHLHLHGGGWVGGAHDSRDVQLDGLARAANTAVVSVGYRLAPEHPYPAAQDDCEAAACWLIDNASSEFGTDRITIGGESAGAHLSAVTLLRLRDGHGFAGFRGAELRFGLYDMRLTPSVRHGRWSRLGPDAIAHLRGMFASDADTWEDPDLSPIFADLHDMPPALFTCGTRDALLDDTVFMWARWRAAGNDAELNLVPGGIHAFDVLPIESSRRAIEQTHRFLAACVREG